MHWLKSKKDYVLLDFTLMELKGETGKFNFIEPLWSADREIKIISLFAY